MLAIGDRKDGFILSHARGVLGSMAHCPMHLRAGDVEEKKRTVSLNSFGTYDGRQRYYPTRGNGSIMELYCATMSQARSLAPAYNGACEMSIQRISGLEEISEESGLKNNCEGRFSKAQNT